MRRQYGEQHLSSKQNDRAHRDAVPKSAMSCSDETPMVCCVKGLSKRVLATRSLHIKPPIGIIYLTALRLMSQPDWKLVLFSGISTEDSTSTVLLWQCRAVSTTVWPMCTSDLTVFVYDCVAMLAVSDSWGSETPASSVVVPGEDLMA